MPIYEYRCENGHLFEVVQRMSDETLTSCATCGAPVQRVFHPVAVHFKGSGFYNTDYGKKKGGGEPSKGEPAKSDSGSGSTSTDSSSSADSKGSDSKKSSSAAKAPSGD